MDVFSGRPNPAWQLTSSDSEDLVKLLSQLPETDKHKEVRDDGLGYRGFILSVTGAGPAAKLPATIRIFKGFVFMNDQAFSDIHSVEKKLIKQADQNGYKSIIDTM